MAQVYPPFTASARLRLRQRFRANFSPDTVRSFSSTSTNDIPLTSSSPHLEAARRRLRLRSELLAAGATAEARAGVDVLDPRL